MRKTKKYASLFLSISLLANLFIAASVHASAEDALCVTKTLDLSSTTLEDWNIDTVTDSSSFSLENNIISLYRPTSGSGYVTPKALPANARIKTISFDYYLDARAGLNQGSNYIVSYTDASNLSYLNINRGGSGTGYNWPGSVAYTKVTDGTRNPSNEVRAFGFGWAFDSEEYISVKAEYNYSTSLCVFTVQAPGFDAKSTNVSFSDPVCRFMQPNSYTCWYKNIVITYEIDKSADLAAFIAQYPVLQQTAADVTAQNAVMMEQKVNTALQAIENIADQDVKSALINSDYINHMQGILLRANLLLNGKATIPAGQTDTFLLKSGTQLGYVNGKLPSVSGKLRFTGGKGVMQVYNSDYLNFDITVTPSTAEDGTVIDTTTDNIKGHVNLDAYKDNYQKYGSQKWKIGSLDWKIGSTKDLELGSVSNGVFTGSWLDFQISYLWISKDGTDYNGRKYIFDIFKDEALTERIADGAWATCFTISDGKTKISTTTLSHSVAQLGQCYTFTDIGALSFNLQNMEMTDVSLDYTTGLAAPEVLGATIKVEQNPSDQDLRFNVQVPAAAAETAAAAGYTPVEIGAVVMTNQKIPADSASEAVLSLGMVGKGGLPVLTTSKAVEGGVLPGKFAVRLKDTGVIASGDAASICGVRFNLRAYIKYQDQDGNNFYVYSDNQKQDTGVENGTASKSVIGIAKAIARAEMEQGADGNTEIESIIAKQGTTTNAEKQALLSFICENAGFVPAE